MNDPAAGETSAPPPALVDVLAHLGEMSAPEVGAALDEASIDEAVSASLVPAWPARWTDRGALPRRMHLGQGLLPAGIETARVDDQLAAIEEIIEEQRRSAHPVRVLSEIGLDHRPGMPPHDVQERVFRALLKLAHRERLPAVLHVVRAHGQLLTILDEEGVPPGSVMHGWTGAPEAMEDLLTRGLVISFGARLLNPKAKRAAASAVAVPDDAFVVESDYPAFPLSSARRVVERLSALRGAEPAHIAKQAADTAQRALRLPP